MFGRVYVRGVGATEDEFKAKPEEVSKEKVTEAPKEGPKKDSKEEVQPNKKGKRMRAGIALSFCMLLFLYLGVTKYFTSHFYFGSEINSVNVTGKTVEEAKGIVLQQYSLTLKEREGKTEQIKASEVGLKYSSEDEFINLKNGQNLFGWILAIFKAKDSQMNVEFSYDNDLLNDRIDKLTFFDSSQVIEPKNASLTYSNNAYVIVDEVPGNKVAKKVLSTLVADALRKGETEIDLAAAGAYIQPKYTSTSEKTIEARDLMNKYVSAEIDYTFGEAKESLDGSTIHQWLEVDQNFEVKLNERKVKEYIAALAETYNTVGKTRRFATSSGTTVNISGGDYGWAIDKAKETQNLIVAIKEGQTITKEPSYSQKAFLPSYGDKDIGNTYVEIDLTKQHVWFYKDGSLLIEGNVVTGNVASGHATPQGVYRLKYKQTNTVLKGSDYTVPVDFWMPFNGGIGMHDASWRSAFGGSIYETNGSHGCINMPYNVAKAIFDHIDVNTPVICY